MAKFTSLLYTMSQLSTRNGKTQYSRIHGNIHAVKRTFTSNRQTHEMIQVLQFIILGANFHFFLSLSLSFLFFFYLLNTVQCGVQHHRQFYQNRWKQNHGDASHKTRMQLLKFIEVKVDVIKRILVKLPLSYDKSDI